MAKQPTLEAEGPVAAAIRHAARQVRKVTGEGDRGMDGPTPERAARANGHLRVGDDRVFRVEDSELMKLCSRGSLDPKDRERNRLLGAAGALYFNDCYLSGMIPSGALDPSRIRVDGGGIGASHGIPASARAEYHRSRFRRAAKAMGARYEAVVNAVVLGDRPVIEVGLAVSCYRNEKLAGAVATDRLREGLRLVAVEYALIPADAT